MQRAGLSRPILYLSAFLIIWLAPSPVRGQAPYKTPVELQETDIFGFGARALGMGNAQVGLADDPSAIFFNPAGLAQLRRGEVTAGLAHHARERRTDHAGVLVVEDDHTRLGEVAFAFPMKTHPRQENPVLTLGFGFHRWADLDEVVGREGLLVAPTTGSPGLYEFESYSRRGAVDAWSTAVGFAVTPSILIGGSLRLLTGNSTEDWTFANYRAQEIDGDLYLDVGDPANPDPRTFEQITAREADAWGVTGSIGFLVNAERRLRLGGVVDFPATLDWEGDSWFRLEDTEKIDSNFGSYPYHFHDDLTLPLTLSGGASLDLEIVTVSAGVRWTDYEQIDFEGDVVAPPDGTSLLPRPAYRDVLAWHLGAEARLGPFRGRAGVFTDPLPYRLLAADADFTFVPDDGDPNTTSDISIVARDYPDAEIVEDRYVLTVGAGLVLDQVFSLDAAYAREEWGRRTPVGYENATTFYATQPTVENATDERLLISATVRFR